MGDVHGPALALAGSGHFSEALAPPFFRRNALGRLFTLAAIRADDIILILKRGHGSGRNHLLPTDAIIYDGNLALHQERAEFLVSPVHLHRAGVNIEQRIAVNVTHGQALSSAGAQNWTRWVKPPSTTILAPVI